MAEKEEHKYLVIKQSDLDDYFGYGLQPMPRWKLKLFEDFKAMLKELNAGRIKPNKYIVCNQDEPYAEEVWQLILDGERKKKDGKKPMYPACDATVLPIKKEGEK
jgi:hypothetical protein